MVAQPRLPAATFPVDLVVGVRRHRPASSRRPVRTFPRGLRADVQDRRPTWHPYRSGASPPSLVAGGHRRLRAGPRQAILPVDDLSLCAFGCSSVGMAYERCPNPIVPQKGPAVLNIL